MLAAITEHALRLAQRTDVEGERRSPARRRADALVAIAQFYADHHTEGTSNRRQERLTIDCPILTLYGSALRGAGVRTAAQLTAFLDERPNLGALERGLFLEAFDGHGDVARTLDGNPIGDGLLSCISEGGVLERLLTVESRVIDHGRGLRAHIRQPVASAGRPRRRLPLRRVRRSGRRPARPSRRALGGRRFHRHRPRRPALRPLPHDRAPTGLVRAARTRRHLRRHHPERRRDPESTTGSTHRPATAGAHHLRRRAIAAVRPHPEPGRPRRADRRRAGRTGPPAVPAPGRREPGAADGAARPAVPLGAATPTGAGRLRRYP